MLRTWMRMMFAVTLVAATAGCPAQHLEPCDQTADCQEGLECFEPVVVRESGDCIAGGFSLSGKACNLRCETDADCGTLGDDYVCTSFGCPGSDRVCIRRGSTGAVAGQVDGGP